MVITLVNTGTEGLKMKAQRDISNHQSRDSHEITPSKCITVSNKLTNLTKLINRQVRHFAFKVICMFLGNNKQQN